jgi:hypothetical protein
MSSSDGCGNIEAFAKFRRLIALVKQVKVVWACDIFQGCALLTSSNAFRQSYETLNPASLSM